MRNMSTTGNLSCLMILFVTVTVAFSSYAPAAAAPYRWKSIIAGGGGFVPGIIYHPAAPGLAYARTDMGGAYRWDNAAARWVPITDMMDRTNSDYMGILSIGLDPNDTNRVYMECGKYTQSWAGTGAVLSSTDRGNSWTINPLTVKIGGNEDGRGAGERLQVDPNLGSLLLMGTTKDGMWRSTDHGTSWARVTTFSPTNVNFVLFDPKSGSSGSATQRIFAAAVNTGGQSLYRSDDGGQTWNPVAGQPSGVMAIRGAIADTLLFVTFSNYQGPNGATTGSVWRYAFTSGTWMNISPSSGSYGFSGIALYPKNPKIVIVSTLDRWSPGDEVYQSTDAGATWAPRLRNGTLDHSYAPYTSTGVNPHWLATLAMDPFDSSKAMFGTGYGIWGCDNLSSPVPLWYFKDANLEETVPMQIISPPFTNLLSAMGDYDGFRHDSLDVSPPNRYNPPKGTTLSIAFAGQVPSRIVKAFNGAPYGSSSTDGGSTWRDFGGRGSTGYPPGATQGGSWAMALSADGNTIVWGPVGASLSWSTDIGKTWTKCGGGVPLLAPVADRVNPLKFYAYDGVSGQLWVSNDGGRSFATGAAGLPSLPSWQSQDGNATAVPGREGHVWLCCGSGGLYRSTNSGATATKVVSVTAGFRMGFGRAFEPGGPPAVYLYGIVDGALGFYRSDDSGGSWTRINDDSHQYGWIHQITGDPRVYGRCYVSAEGRGIFYGEPQDSTARSEAPSTFRFDSRAFTSLLDSLRHPVQSVAVRWSKASDPPLSKPLTYILRLFGPGLDTAVTCTDTAATVPASGVRASSTYILSGTVTNGTDTTCSANCLLVPAASALTAVGEAAPGAPAVFTLFHNYPNPFNPHTMISYQLALASRVTLKVFDIVGREIVTLVRGSVEAAGIHQVSFDATHLSSGTYLYRLETEKFTDTKSMVLVK